MINIRLFLLFSVCATLAALHAFPFLPRPERLFGVAVPRAVRYGPQGRDLLRRYQFQLAPWSCAAFLITLWLPLSLTGIWALAFPLVTSVMAIRLFSRRRAEALPYAVPAPSTREFRLTREPDRLPRLMLLFVFPIAILAGTAVYLNLHWDDIPARFPVHWGADGRPNGWSNRTFQGVYGPLLIGGIVVLYLAGLSALTLWGSRRSARPPGALIALVALGYIIAASFSLAGLLPLHLIPTAGLLAFHAACFVFIAGVIWLSVRHRAVPEAEPGEVTPEACWHAGAFYYNPHDPALFVEHRIGVGWTLNLGNRLFWIVLPLMLLVPLAVVFLARAFTAR